MGKKDKPVKPFVLDLMLNLEGLDVPPETSAPEIVQNWMIRGIQLVGEESRGFTIQNHLKMKRCRAVFEEAVKTKSTTATFEPEEWFFLKKCFDDARFLPNANEVVFRIHEHVQRCVSEHDRAVNEEMKGEDNKSHNEVRSAEGVVSSQEV